MIRDGAWLQEQKFRPLTYFVPEILPEGFTVAAGAPKIGKSLWSQKIGLECARGGYVLGQKCRKCRVLYLALEDSDRRLQERSWQLLEGEEIPPWFSYMLRIEPDSLIDEVSGWLDRQPKGCPALVVVDTFGRAMSKAKRGENAYDRDYRVSSELGDLSHSRPRTCIVGNHHTRKEHSDDFMERVSGTNGITGGADTISVITRPRGSDNGKLQITSREIEDAEYALVKNFPTGWQPEGGSLDSAAQHAAVTRQLRGGEAEDIAAYLLENYPAEIHAQRISEATGIGRAKCDAYLSKMVKDGNIVRPKRGFYRAAG